MGKVLKLALRMSLLQSFLGLLFSPVCLKTSKNLSQSPYALPDFSLVQPRLAQDYSRPRMSRHKAMGYSGDADPARCRMGHQSFFRSGFCGPQYDMSSRTIAG